MKTVLKLNQLSLFTGASLKQAVGTTSRAGIQRIRIASSLKVQLKDEYTYPSGAIRVPLEFKLAYAELFAMTPRNERKSLRLFFKIGERTHYRWLTDAKSIQDGTARVRTHIRRG
ncbi:hypothetical protein NVP1026O_079 [Vibrio phage 1.026.O._10N.222.49.C7]|uniref:Uncharacterized protein n=1 Tax=Vibrio phage 1.026.O._10N.222.49.C7 TaxID=1881421 RepID=A0A2I7QMP6_9CAUD|nr:hypothetical protein HYP57_gp106 [Vibrio phage 1.026.O._10N.222.49.C7]AUR82670.1 hypothetical protein NVP1026O_079 [Vibrio phage 1.026.O._10N.222.49.C7]